MILKLFVISVSVHLCGAVIIYSLSDSEYDRMPPMFELEKYESCLTQTYGVYCLTQIELYADPPNELIKLLQDYSAHHTKHYNHSKIERGVCLTKSCKKFIKNVKLLETAEIKQVLEACLNENLKNEYGLLGHVTKIHCDRHKEDSKTDIFDWIVLVFITGIIVLNIIGTIWDVIDQRQKHEKNNSYDFKYYLLCFSVIQNWNWLISSEPGDTRIRRVKGLHCLKTLVIYLFIFGHAFYIFHGFTENPHQFEKYYSYIYFKMLFNGMVLVQILFTVSGFLLVYLLMIESEKAIVTWKLMPKIIVLRLWRLSPANLVYVLFSATWLRHLGSGPLWKVFVTERMSGDCRKYWWSHLLFMNNYITDDRFCVVQNWQLAADVQLFIFGLVIFMVTKASNRTVVLNSIIVLGMTATGLHIWWQDLDAFLLTTPEVYRTFDSENYVVHKFAHVNLPGFMIGMLTGLRAYEWQKNKVDISKYRNLLSTICYFVIPFIACICYSGSFFYTDVEYTSLSIRIAYGVLHRPVMAAVTAFIILAMIMNFDDFWLSFLEWDGWVIPSKLTYSVSLIHTFFIIMLYGTRTQLTQISVLNHTIVHLAVGILSFLTAVPYCLMFEAPMNRFIKVIATQKMVRKKLE